MREALFKQKSYSHRNQFPCHLSGILNLGFPGSLVDKETACSAGDLGSILGSGRSLEKEMATQSNILAWRNPWTEESGGLQTIGLQESDMN